MRGGGDREVALVEVVAGPRERQRLERLRGRAHEREEARLPGGLDHAPVLHGDGVHAVARLDDLATPHGYADRVHEQGNLRCLSYPRSRRGAAA